MDVNKTTKFAVFGQKSQNTKQVTVTKNHVANTTTNNTKSKEDNEKDVEQLILGALSTKNEIDDSWNFAQENKLDHQAVVGAIKSLLPDAYVKDEMLTTSYYELTEEGKEILEKGSPEYQVFITVANNNGGNIGVNDLNQRLGELSKIGLGPCLKNKWLKKEGEVIVKVSDNVVDEVQVMLLDVNSNKNIVSEENLKNLKRRKLVQMITRKSYRITKGESYQPTRVKRMADLTKEMLGNLDEVSINLIYYYYLYLSFSLSYPVLF